MTLARRSTRSLAAAAFGSWLAVSAAVAGSLPTAKPEDVGMSSERLASARPFAST